MDDLKTMSVEELDALAAKFTRSLTADELVCLRALPDPAGEVFRNAIRARDLVNEGKPAYPHLTELERLGLATGKRGWWKKSRLGVVYLRRLAREAAIA